MPIDYGKFPAHYYPTSMDAKRARIKRTIGYLAVFSLMAAMGAMIGYAI